MVRLQRLQQEGYIVDSPSLQQSRPTVAPLTREDAMELFSIVAEIEGLAARRRVHCRRVQRDALVRDLTAINARFERASRAKTPKHDLLYELDEQFHRQYVDGGGRAAASRVARRGEAAGRTVRTALREPAVARARAVSARSIDAIIRRSALATPTRRSAPCRRTGATPPTRLGQCDRKRRGAGTMVMRTSAQPRATVA